MHCNGFDHELRDSIERRDTAGRPELREHALGCARCRPVWEQHVLLERAVQTWKGRVPPVDLTDRIMAHWAFDGGAELSERLGYAETPALSAEHNGRLLANSPRLASGMTRPAERRIGGGIVVAAAVAALAILLSPLLWRANDQVGPDVPDVAGPAQRNEAPAPRGERPPQDRNASARVEFAQGTVRLDSAVREAGSAWMGLANEATGTVREMAVFLPERTLIAAVSPAEPVEPASRWTDRLRQDIAPIGRDVGKAMDFLLEAVSVGPERAL